MKKAIIFFIAAFLITSVSFGGYHGDMKSLPPNSEYKTHEDDRTKTMSTYSTFTLQTDAFATVNAYACAYAYIQQNDSTKASIYSWVTGDEDDVDPKGPVYYTGWINETYVYIELETGTNAWASACATITW